MKTSSPDVIDTEPGQVDPDTLANLGPPDGRRSYHQHPVLVIRGRDGLFDHHDSNTLRTIAEPTPNPPALG